MDVKIYLMNVNPINITVQFGKEMKGILCILLIIFVYQILQMPINLNTKLRISIALGPEKIIMNYICAFLITLNQLDKHIVFQDRFMSKYRNLYFVLSLRTIL